MAALGAGRTELAVQHAERATELRPQHHHTWEKLAWALVAAERFDDAIERLSEAPLPDATAYEAWRQAELASVETRRALAYRRDGRAEEAAQAIEAAATYRDQAVRLVPKFPLTRGSLVLLAALESEDTQQVATALINHVAEDPLQWWKLRDLLEHMPGDLDPEGTTAVRELIRAMVTQLRTTSSNN